MLRCPGLLALLIVVGESLAFGDVVAVTNLPPPSASFLPCGDAPQAGARQVLPADLAGNGSGFLIVGGELAQPLDAAGRPTATAHPLYLGNVIAIDAEWAGDRYAATYRTLGKEFFFTLGSDGAPIAEATPVPYSSPRLAWNGATGVIVGRATGQGIASVYAARVTRVGELGDPVLIGNGALGEFDVEAEGDGYVVVMATDHGALLAQRLDRGGARIAGPQFLLPEATPANTPTNIRIASGPAGTAVVYRIAIGDEATLYAAAIPSTGTAGAPSAVLEQPGRELHLAPTASGFVLVTERQEPGTWEREPLGIALTPDARPASSLTPLPALPRAIASVDGGALVLASAYGFASWVSVTFPVDADGRPSAAPQPALLGVHAERNVRLASDGSRSVLAWIARTASGDRIESAILTNHESVACLPVRASSVVIAGFALASSPAETLIVWGENRVGHAALLTGDRWIELPLAFPLNSAMDFTADLAWDGSAFRLVWLEGTAVYTTSISPAGVIGTPVLLLHEGLDDPHVLPTGETTLVAARTSHVLFDGPSYTGAAIVAFTSGGSATVHEILPLRRSTLGWTSTFPEADVDIAKNGSTVMAALTDRHDVHAIVVGADGAPLQKTRIAGGAGIASVAIAPLGDGFAIAWLAEDRRPRAGAVDPVRYRLFVARVDASGALLGALIGTDGPMPGTSQPEIDLVADANGFIVAYDGYFASSASSFGGMRAFAAYSSFLLPYAGALPAPGSPFLARLEKWSYELHWTPVPGANGYIVQENIGAPERWVTLAFVPADAGQYDVGFGTRFRIATLHWGLASEWIVLELPRRRLIRREASAGGAGGLSGVDFD